MSIGIYLRITIFCIAGVFLGLEHLNAQILVTKETTVQGTVVSTSGQNIAIRTNDGRTIEALMSIDPKTPTVILGNGTRLRAPLETMMVGRFGPDVLTAGDILQFEGNFNRLGKTSGRLASLNLLIGTHSAGILPIGPKQTSPNEYQSYQLTATYNKVVNDRLLINVPGNQHTKVKILSFQLQPNCVIEFTSTDPKLISASMEIQRATIQELNTGDSILKEISLTTKYRPISRDNFDNALRKKYANLSNTPMNPRMIRSQNFIFMSDISELEARVLLEKLETMHSLLGGYFRARPSTIIEGFIVDDITRWPDNILQEPAGIAKIKEGAGICFSSSVGNNRRAVIYSCADHGVVQHESTHGFCSLTFGSTGPTWLAEGIAELGQYWRPGETQVSLPPPVLDYLQKSPQKSLLEIAVPGRVPAGNWQDYAWRWALCQLLANNPNYSGRFKPLAIALMQQQPTVSFEATYGDIASQISFEYAFFLEHLQNGYRNDLCAWQWNRTFSRLNGSRQLKVKVKAKYGWQASGLILEKGKAYDIAAVGKWSLTAEKDEVTARGNDRGNGSLMGIIFNDFKLSAEFELGERASFPAPQDGLLFVRCKESFNRLHDNSGELDVYMRLTP